MCWMCPALSPTWLATRVCRYNWVKVLKYKHTSFYISLPLFLLSWSSWDPFGFWKSVAAENVNWKKQSILQLLRRMKWSPMPATQRRTIHFMILQIGRRHLRCYQVKLMGWISILFMFLECSTRTNESRCSYRYCSDFLRVLEWKAYFETSFSKILRKQRHYREFAFLSLYNWTFRILAVTG